MTDEELKEKVKLLEGISLAEWWELRQFINGSFQAKVNEINKNAEKLKQQLKLSCDD